MSKSVKSMISLFETLAIQEAEVAPQNDHEMPNAPVAAVHLPAPVLQEAVVAPEDDHETPDVQDSPDTPVAAVHLPAPVLQEAVVAPEDDHETPDVQDSPDTPVALVHLPVPVLQEAVVAPEDDSETPDVTDSPDALVAPVVQSVSVAAQAPASSQPVVKRHVSNSQFNGASPSGHEKAKTELEKRNFEQMMSTIFEMNHMCQSSMLRWMSWCVMPTKSKLPKFTKEDFKSFFQVWQDKKRVSVNKECKHEGATFTPLQFAIRLGSIEMIEALIEFGANVNLAYNSLPVDIVRNRSDIVQLLESKGAQSFGVMLEDRQNTPVTSQDMTHMLMASFANIATYINENRQLQLNYN